MVGSLTVATRPCLTPMRVSPFISLVLSIPAPPQTAALQLVSEQEAQKRQYRSRLESEVARNGRDPFPLLPHWAPQPNVAARLVDRSLILFVTLIFVPVFATMKIACYASKPLDLISAAITKRYIMVNRPRQTRSLQSARGRERGQPGVCGLEFTGLSAVTAQLRSYATGARRWVWGRPGR